MQWHLPLEVHDKLYGSVGVWYVQYWQVFFINGDKEDGLY